MMAEYYNSETKIIEMPAADYEIEPAGIGRLIFNKMTLNADKVVQINAAANDQPTTHGELLARYIRCALVMRQRGIVPGDIIAICSHYHEHIHIPLVASIFTGAVFSPLDSTASREDTIMMLNILKPKCIFVSAQREALVSALVEELSLPSKIVVFGASENHNNATFDDYMKTSDDEKNFAPYECANLKELTAIYFSSGTTGGSKPVMLINKQFMCYTRKCFENRAFLITALCWITRLGQIITMLTTGGCEIVNLQFDAAKMWDHIGKYNLTALMLAAPHYQAMCQQEIKNLECLKYIILGGKVVDTETMIELYKVFKHAEFMNVYGATELGWCFVNPQPIDVSKINSIGVPENGKSYKIVDIATDRNVGANQHGELRIKSEWIFTGYYKLDSMSSFDADGYYKTGDIGYYDDKFNFYIVDRVKEVFTYNGTAIYPSSMEPLVMQHPAVAIAAIIGVAQEGSTDSLALAIVELNSTATSDEIRTFVDGLVDENRKLRGGVKIIEQMPMTPSGKIRKNVLRSMLANNLL